MRSRFRYNAFAFAFALAGTNASAVPSVSRPVATAVLRNRADGLDARSGRILMSVTAINDQVLRVRIGRDRFPQDASWAVPHSVRAAHVLVHPLANGFETSAIRVTVDPMTLALRVTDLSGNPILIDDAEPICFDGDSFTLRKSLPPGEHVYGLGDKTGGTLDRRGKTFVDWNTDSYGFDSSTDPIYKSIPFFIGVAPSGLSYGLLLDNSWRTAFDFGHAKPDRITMAGPDGPIDYYVIAGPKLRDVVRRYTDLTGKAPLPPLWALGYQQSRYSYMSQGEVEQIARRLRQDHIPTDVIWLDIDYQDRNRPFTVNRTIFPNLKGLVDQLGSDGIKLVAITDLHVADAPDQGYAPYDTGIAGNHFVHLPDGSVYVGKVWPGPSVFPDFTDSSARMWWGTNFRPLVDAGIAGFWNDMNEPSVFNGLGTMPLDVVHRVDSDDFPARNASHAEIHNVYGLENSRATFDGLRMLRPQERAFVMTRASYAGGQRYAVTWTGDNSSTWDHLKLMVHQLINLGLSGFSYAGADIGGFTGGPSPNLMTRWFEIGAFTPIFRDHSAKDAPRAEPWIDGPAQLAIRRKFVEERYRLLPYFYALADLNSRNGDPLMRPVFYDYPDSLQASCDQSMTFTLGGALLIAPPPKMESPQSYDVCLPKGQWYDYWTGRLMANSATISEKPRLDYLPIFVRAGTILPRQPLVQSTSQTPRGPLSLDIYPGPDCNGVIYFDDGHSMRFRQGDYLRQTIRCAISNAGDVSVSFGQRMGSYRPWWNQIQLNIHERASPLRFVGSGATPVEVRYDRVNSLVRVLIGDIPSGGTLTFRDNGPAPSRRSSS